MLISFKRCVFNLGSPIGVALLFGACHKTPNLPAPTVATQAVSLSQLWLGASSVIVGSATEVHRVRGPQLLKQHDGSSVSVYACEANLTISNTIRGKVTTSRVLWFSYSPDCPLASWPYDKLVDCDRVWFVREDAGWLRPVYDNAAVYLEISRSSNLATGGGEMQAAFVHALLSAGNLEPASGGLANRLVEFYSLAVEIVGEEASLKMLAELQKQASVALRSEICRMVAGTYDECRFSDCTQNSTSIRPIAPDASWQEFRHIQQAESISSDAIASAFRSGSSAKRDVMHRRLRLLSCNVDPQIRRRALSILHKYFPLDPPVNCIPCK